MQSFENLENANAPFYCISHYEGDISWLDTFPKCGYIIYSKGLMVPDRPNIKKVRNVGYNLSSYLDFIICNYENLPEITVFCKNNIFERHVMQDRFRQLVKLKIFTPLEDERFWTKLRFPVSTISNDGGYLELNNNWYASKYIKKYFNAYDDFLNYVFDFADKPTFLRFAPGANYLVPKANILLRSKNFYINLNSFISHHKLSCESHFLERSLISIWGSGLKSASIMDTVIASDELNRLINNVVACNDVSILNKFKRYIHRQTISWIHNFFDYKK